MKSLSRFAAIAVSSLATLLALQATTVDLHAAAPVITRPPLNTSAEQGGSFSLSVLYTSALPATVQWQRDPDGLDAGLPFADIPGATSAEYTASAAQPATHGGAYRAVVTSADGPTLSDHALVTISPPSGTLIEPFVTSISLPSIRAAAFDVEGRIVIASSTQSFRLLATGATDPAFASHTYNNVVNAVFSQTGANAGKTLVIGTFTVVDGQISAPGPDYVARLLADGTIDTSFPVIGGTGVQAFAPGAGDKFYVGKIDGYGLERRDANGVYDATFVAPAIFFNASKSVTKVWAIRELRDGRVLVSHQTADASNNLTGIKLERLSATGAADATFVSPLLNFGIITGIDELPDGRIAIAGRFTTINGVARNHVALLNADGTLDPSFDPGVGLNTTGSDPLYGVREASGRLLVWGDFTTVNASAANGLIRFNLDGSVDSTFAIGTGAAGGKLATVAIAPDGTLFVGGGFTTFNGVTHTRAALLANNTRIGSIGFAQLRASVLDDSGTVTLTLRRQGLDPAPASIHYATADVTATAGTDYTATEGTVTWARDDFADKTISIPLLGDTAMEPTETFRVILSAATGPVTAGPAATIELLDSDTPPSFTTPLNAVQTNLTVGGSLVLNVSVASPTPVTYLWFRNGVLLPDVTGPGYVATPLTLADAGLYTLVVTNAAGSLASAPVPVLVAPLGAVADPAIVNPPVRSDANPGSTARLFAGAVGTNLTYLWSKAGVPLADGARISGATTAVLTITGLVAGDDALYTVAVTGGTPATTVTSTPVKINVLGAPSVATSPASVTPAFGATVTLAADVLAATPATYVWRRDGVVIQNGGRYSGATTGKLVITGANNSDNGAYTLTVTNAQGTTSTTPATVAVAQNVTDRDPATTALGSTSTVTALLNLPDGRTLVAGNLTGAASTTAATRLAVVGTDYRVAPTPVGDFQASPTRLVRQPDGKILVLGGFTTIGGLAGSGRVGLARLNPDLTLDPTFLPPVPNNVTTSAAVDAQGRIYLGGLFTLLDGRAGASYLVRLLPDGRFDPAFSITLNGKVQDLVIQPDGKLLVSGDFNTYGPTAIAVKGLIRLQTDGTLDPAFSSAIVPADAFSNSVTALALDSQNRIVAGYYSISSSFAFTYGVARLLPSGAKDPGFNFTETLNQPPPALLVMGDDKIVAGGPFTSSVNGFLRINADGTRDTAFTTSLGVGFGVGGADIRALALDSLGRLWLGGGFTSFKGVTVNRLLVLQGDSPALAFAAQPSGVTRDLAGTATFTATALGNNGFTYQWFKNGAPLADGGRISGATTAALTITGLVAADGAAYTVVVTTSPGVSRTSAPAPLVVLAAPEVVADPASLTVDFGASATLTGSIRGAAPLAYQWLFEGEPVANGTVGGATIAGATTPTLTITGATFSQAGDYRLRATNSLGTATTAPAVLTVQRRPGALATGVFQPTFNGEVRAIQPLSDGSFLVGGAFSSVTVNGTTTSRGRLAHILASGALDLNFAPTFNDNVNTLAVDSAGRVFVGGDFTSITLNGTFARVRVARLNSVTASVSPLGIDTAFDTSAAGPNTSVFALAPVGDGSVYIGGSFLSIGKVNTAAVARMARLDASGALDTSFTSGAPATPVDTGVFVNSILRLPDGTLYAGGASNTWNNTLAPNSATGRLVKLAANGDRDFNFVYPESLGIPTCIIRLADGNLLVGANSTPSVRKLTPAGTIIPLQTVPNTIVNTLAQQADGKILYGGQFTTFTRTVPASPKPLVTTYSTNRLGRTDADTFDTGLALGSSATPGFSSTVLAVATDASGRIYVGGSFTTYDGIASSRFAILAGGEFDSRSSQRTPQTLTFPAIATRTFGKTLAENTVTLAATSDAGLTPVTFAVTSGPATVSGNTLTITGAGTITVAASQAGDAAYAPANASRTFTVNKAEQTITFGTLANKSTTAAPFVVSATSDSGLAIKFGISGPATISGDTVTLTGAEGTVVVTATQPGDANYSAALSKQQSFTVSAGVGQQITFTQTLPNRQTTALPFDLTATSTSGLPVQFIVSGQATLGVNGKTLTLTGVAGTVTVTATQPGGDRLGITYGPAPVIVRTFEVTPVPPVTQSITFNQPVARTFGSAPAPLVATAKLPVRFEIVSSVPAGIASIGEDGKTLTLTGAGTVKLRATQPGGPGFFAATPIERDLVVNKAAQKITTFNVLSPIPLSLTTHSLSDTAASSGLPVTVSYVSGPATIGPDGKLVLTGTGAVRLRATQAGNENYLAAPAVEKTITVTSTAVLSISAPAVTYDGLDHPVIVTGAPEGLADKLTVTYNGSTALPRNAGTYAVVASLGTLKKTASLVIKKAELAVSFDDRVRLVATANPTFFEPHYTGFKDDDTVADLAATTRPRGITKALVGSTQGDYPITFATGAVDKNYLYVPGAPAVLHVLGFGGTYEALLLGTDSIPVGKLTLTVSSNSLGYSGTLNLAREAKSVIVSSTVKPPSATTLLVAAEDLASASATWTRTGSGVDALALAFTVRDDGTLAGSLTRNGEAFANLSGGRLLYVAPAKTLIPWAGQHTLALHSAFVILPANEGPFPRGSGVATAVVSTVNGNLVLTGKLADGTTLTATLKPWITRTEGGALDQVGYVAWIAPYGTRTESFLAGALDLLPQPEPGRFPAGRRYIPSDDAPLTWKKAGALTDKSYHAGFGPLSVSVSLDPWLPPVVAKPAKGAIPAVEAITLPQRLGLAADNTTAANLTISHGPEALDLGERESALPFAATLNATAAPTVTTALTLTSPPVNLTTWKLTSFSPATGAFAGTFVLSDTVAAPTKANPSATKPFPRTVAFTGTLRQAPADEGDVLLGTGFFLVPGFSSSSEQPSGEIRFSAPAPAP